MPETKFKLVFHSDQGSDQEFSVSARFEKPMIRLQKCLAERAPNDAFTACRVYVAFIESLRNRMDKELATLKVTGFESDRHFDKTCSYFSDCIAFFDASRLAVGKLTDFSSWSVQIDHTDSISYPRLWDLLRFILGSKNRERLFTPAYNDLLADHLESQLPIYQTTWARRWIQFCFGVRTAWLVTQCVALGFRGAAAAVIVPVAIREAVLKWWYGG